MRAPDHVDLAFKGVFSSKFSLLSNTLSVFIGLGFFGTLISLSVGVGEFLEKYYTRTMSLTSIVVYNDPDTAESRPFDKTYRDSISKIGTINHILYHDIHFAEIEIEAGRTVMVALRSAAPDDPEIDRLELVAGTNVTGTVDPIRPPVVISLARAQRLSDLPPTQLIGKEIALTFQRSINVDDAGEKESIYGRIVGVANETPDESVYVPYSLIAAASTWQRSLQKQILASVPASIPVEGGDVKEESRDKSPEVPSSDQPGVDRDPSTPPTPDVRVPATPEPQDAPESGASPTRSDQPDGDQNEKEVETESGVPERPAAPAVGDDTDPAIVEVEANHDRSATDGAPTESVKVFSYRQLNDAWKSIQPQIDDDTIAYPHLRIHVRDVNTVLALRNHFREHGISTESSLDDVAAIRELRNYAFWVGTIVGLITLLAGFCSILNTLLASVERRTKEIGILRALGASSFNILVIFLLEGAINAIVGGVLAAAAIYWASGFANTWILRRLSEGADFAKLAELKPALFVYPAWLPVLILAVGVGASLLAALGPALVACWLQPTKALRHA